MELKEFSVDGLFDLYNHKINFSSPDAAIKRATIIMLYGKNGIGKTTILRMIKGMITLNFNVFREIKFESACLKFTNNSVLQVQSNYDSQGILQFLDISYKNIEVKLKPDSVGPLTPDQSQNQEMIVDKYRSDLRDFSFEFIDSERIMRRVADDEQYIHEQVSQGKIYLKPKRNRKPLLVDMVKNFITESQVYNTRFFKKEEPDLFERILLNIESNKKIEITELKKRINSIVKTERDFEIKRLGIVPEKWDKQKLTDILTTESKNKIKSTQKLTIINSYLEVLESSNNEKVSLANRLLTFESIINDFLLDKKIKVASNVGFEIKTKTGDIITEDKLSTGEYHLLYLTVLALCTTVKGTVIAIDEPEMSMHISWQNKLINALLKISSRANPQFIFATHSPDIASNYSNSLVTVSYGKN